MEKHNLDRFFEEKLDSHEVEPTPQAWDALSEGLSKKRKINVWGWLSIAASAALLLTSAYLLVQNDADEPGENYMSDYSVSDIAPDVPNFEPQLPVFIRQQTSVAEATKIVPGTTQIQKQDNIVVESEIIQVADKDNQGSQHQKDDDLLGPLLDSELIKTTPVLVAEQIEDQGLVQPGAEEQPAVLASSEQINEPVTIIYKQGEVEEQSKISKALSFMDEVRKGEKKLIDMNKITTNIFAKNKEQVSNSE